MLKIPVAASAGAVVTLGDVAQVQADLQGRDLDHARQRPLRR